ncbi:MAG: hypothetical protein HQK51_14495 [Oligoflexia bacterium]|nr:hypothetical protein [Oligoflexia bacterium]
MNIKLFFILLYLMIIFLFLINFISFANIQIISDINDSQMQKDIEYNWGNDPFIKNVGYFHNLYPINKKYILSGIVQTGDNLAAIINKVILHKNQYIDDYLIKEIGKNYVLIEKDNSIIELQLPPIKEVKQNIQDAKNNNENEKIKIHALTD